TIASAKRDLTQWTAMVIEPDTTGFVVRYDTGSGAYQVIWDKLWYPTSIEITDDRTALLVAEFSSRKVLKYYIKGRLRFGIDCADCVVFIVEFKRVRHQI